MIHVYLITDLNLEIFEEKLDNFLMNIQKNSRAKIIDIKYNTVVSEDIWYQALVIYEINGGRISFNGQSLL